MSDSVLPDPARRAPSSANTAPPDRAPGSSRFGDDLRNLAVELLLELACIAAVYLPTALIGRAVILYLHSQGERAAIVPIDGFLNPAYYIEDIQSFFWVAGLCLLPGLWISRRLLLRQALIAGFLFVTVVLYVAGVNYYATYEVQFGWNHLLKWEGTGEMLTSIRAETPWIAIYTMLGAGALLVAWTFATARLLARRRAATLASASSEEHLGVWPGGVRLMALSLVLLPAPYAGMPYQHFGSPEEHGADFDAAYRRDIERTLHTNVLNQLVFTFGGGKNPDAYDLITPDGKRFLSTRPFQFRFETDSLAWLAKVRAAERAAGENPDGVNSDATPDAKSVEGAPTIIAPVSFPVRGKKYNIVLYFFESTTARYLEETVAAYPPMPDETANQNSESATGVPAEPKPDPTVTSEAGAASGDSQDAPQPAAELPVTPTWHRLAEHALVGRNHYVQAPLSINALFNIFTSAYALPADRWAATDYPDIPLVSLSEILHERGYRTGIFHTGTFDYAGQGKFLKHRKFDVMHDAGTGLRVAPYTEEINWGIDDRALIAPSVNFARASKAQGQPFFLTAMPVAPHHPYDVPGPEFELYKIDPDNDEFPDRWKRAFAKYKNALYYSDYVLGEFIKAFEHAGLAEDTIFIVYADHGEAFGQHRGNYNHPFYVYEENVHVPFLIYNQTLFPESIEYTGVSRHVDILPTVLDMLGLIAARDPRHEGRSLLAGGPPQMATFYTSWRNRLAGLRDGRWKYIYNLETGREELYDLRKDPAETRDVADAALKDRYRNYIFELTVYQRKFFEKVLNRSIDWSATQEKDEGPVRPNRSGESSDPTAAPTTPAPAAPPASEPAP